MTKVINVADYESTSFREIRLKTIMNGLIRKKDYFDTNDERKRSLTPGRFAKKYLEYTGQYRHQFELCLKKFDGKTSEQFTKKKKRAIIKLYEEHIIERGENLKKFVLDKINTKDVIIFDFEELEKKIDSTNRHNYEFFLWYGFDVLNKSEELKDSESESIRRMRIYNCSPNTLDKLEGKLRELGKFSCIYEAIEFVSLRIDLDGKYHFKKLVDNLDELFEDFLVDKSKNEINTKKAREDLNELVKEAIKKYEVLGQPTYMIDMNSYKSAVRSKFKSKLKRKNKSSENE